MNMFKYGIKRLLQLSWHILRKDLKTNLALLGTEKRFTKLTETESKRIY